MPLFLLGTDGCHLCECAKSLLEHLHIDVTYIDIMTSPELLDAFATQIPVLYHSPSNCHLNWPFESSAIISFIDTHKDLS